MFLINWEISAPNVDRTSVLSMTKRGTCTTLLDTVMTALIAMPSSPLKVLSIFTKRWFMVQVHSSVNIMVVEYFSIRSLTCFSISTNTTGRRRRLTIARNKTEYVSVWASHLYFNTVDPHVLAMPKKVILSFVLHLNMYYFQSVRVWFGADFNFGGLLQNLPAWTVNQAARWWKDGRFYIF